MCYSKISQFSYHKTRHIFSYDVHLFFIISETAAAWKIQDQLRPYNRGNNKTLTQ